MNFRCNIHGADPEKQAQRISYRLSGNPRLAGNPEDRWRLMADASKP